MDMLYVKSVIKRAQDSLVASSGDETYCDMLEKKIEDADYYICLDQEVTSLDHLDDSHIIEPYLEKYVKDLEVSI